MPDLRDTLQHALGSQYRIVRELTGGGMSRVFLAQDERLQREVAVKLLSPDLLDEARVERFRQEVLQTARLQHPTIVPVIDVGAIEDVPGHHIPYYIMPYARGESLRSRLHHEGQLSFGVTMRVLRSVFDALAYAHAHGVVHRDIKPENIFLSGTNALLADFGIAKAISGPGSHGGVTQPGMAVGTVSYMAPEQLVDHDHVGPRADLFALGVVAYEMLTGRLPWGNTTPVQALASQARGRITPLRSLRPDLPVAMTSIIESCLAWEPERRPESAASALQTLESIPVQHTPDTAQSIEASVTAERIRRLGNPRRLKTGMAMALLVALAVVVPLYMSAPSAPATSTKLGVLYPDLPPETPSRRVVAEQLYHGLLATLAPVSGLRIVGRTSVQRMSEQGLSPAQISDSLRGAGAEMILEIDATVPPSGGAFLSIKSRFAGSQADATVAGPIPVGALDRFSPDSIARLVRVLAAQAVTKLHLVSTNRTVSETRMTDATMAWIYGRDAQDRRTSDGLRAAIGFFEHAIALDPAYTQAYADLATTLTLTLVYHYRTSRSPTATAAYAFRMATRAVELQPKFADGYLALGLLGVTAGAPVADIKRDLDNAAQFASANPYLQTWQLGLLGRQGDFEEAARRAEEEVQLDQASPGKRVTSAMYAFPTGRYITAIRNATTARSMNLNIPLVAQLELWAMLRQGGESLAECVSVPAGPYLGARALCLERAGRANEARAAHDSLYAILSGKLRADSTFDLALPAGEMALYASQHRDPAAVRTWLRQAFDDSPHGLDYRMMRSGMFEPAQIAYADSLQKAAWGRVYAAAHTAGARPD